MAQKRVTRASKRRLLFFGTISVVTIFYFIFSVFNYAMNIYRLQKEERELTQNLTSLKSDEKRLKTEIEKLKDPEYLARYARENYLYSKDGEIVIKVQADHNKKVETDKSETNYAFVIWIGSLSLLCIMGYVIRKSKR